MIIEFRRRGLRHMLDKPLAEVFHMNLKERAPVESINRACRRRAFCYGNCGHRTEKTRRFTGCIFGSGMP
jgi:hypothetical protein